MSRYVINAEATQDLNEIAEYFAETSLEAGERFFREFDRKCQQLIAFPNSGKSYAHRRKAPIRKLPTIAAFRKYPEKKRLLTAIEMRFLP